MTQEEILYREIGEQFENAISGQMFGKPCFKINGKAFICFFENAMVFKLTGDVHKQALELNDSLLFDPSGKKRPMKEWVQVAAEHKDQWQLLATSAYEYIA